MSLFLHQDEAAETIAARGKLYLGDEPGLGKTRSVIHGEYRAGSTRPLIIAPAIVRTHWHREFAECGWPFGAPPIIKSYDEIVRGGFRLMRDLLQDEGVDALVVDEAHYCKHANTQRTQLILGPQGYARRLERVVLASGTPQPKHPGELFTQLCYVFPEVLREYGVTTYDKFIARYGVIKPRFIRGQMMDKVVGAQNTDELHELLSRVMLRRTLADVGLDVPQIFWQQIRLDAKVRPQLDEVTAATVKMCVDADALEQIKNDPHVARMRRELGELKVAPAAEMLISQLADSDEKVVVFAHHRTVLAGLRELLGTFGVAYIDGDVSDSRRAGEIDRFQTDPRCRVFLGQNIACQTGITLTAAHRVVLVEPDWTGVTNVQLAKRTARIGQTSDRVIAQLIVLADTIDEAIIGQNLRETRMAEQVGLGTQS